MMLSVGDSDVGSVQTGTGSADYYLLERGDAPAQQVLDKNARSLAQRMADETREELARVMMRVDNIYGTFEVQDTLYSTNTRANLEYVGSMNELEELVTDQVTKHKYQQQVTVFIVGYQSACTQKFRLLQQVNDFFNDNTNVFDTDDEGESDEPFDLDEVSNSIEESLEYAQTLATRLGQINQEIIQFAANYTGGKGGNKNRKKLEKTLATAREDVVSLNEKLTRAQMDLELKEEKIQGMYKTIEIRSIEVQRFKTAAEAAKRSVQETDLLRIELAKREDMINSMKDHLNKMEKEYMEADKRRQDDIDKAAEGGNNAENKIASMKELLFTQQDEFDRLTSDLMRQHDKVLSVQKESAEKQMTKMQRDHQKENNKLQDRVEDLTRQLAEAKNNVVDVEEALQREKSHSYNTDRQDVNSQSTKKTKSTVGGSKKNTPIAKKEILHSRGKSEVPVDREYTDGDVQDEYSQRTGPHSQASSRGSNVVMMEFEDTIDVDADEEIWENLPRSHIPGRFKQYRQMVNSRLKELEEQIKDLQEKMARKVTTLKAQFSEHKAKWEAERLSLSQQIEHLCEHNSLLEKDTEQMMDSVEQFVDKVDAAETGGHLPDTDPELLKQTDDAKAEEFMKSASNHDDNDSDLETEEHLTSERNKVRESLADGRASLRDRRDKSPTHSLKSNKSFISDLELDEDGDMPIPADSNGSKSPTASKPAMTSTLDDDSVDIIIPSTREAYLTPSQRHTMRLSDHPVVLEFIKVYKVLINFKEKLQEDMHLYADDLKEIKAVEFVPDERIQPQLESMTINAGKILDLVIQLFHNSTKKISAIKPPEVFTDLSLAEGQISVLQQQVARLEQIIQDSTDKYERELNQKTNNIGKLEERVDKLKNELSMLGKVVEDDPPERLPEPEVPIMFTRLDLERNGKAMKRAVNGDRLDKEKYKEALETMDSYVSIPAKRLGHLVRKYVHHRQMREIEECVKKSHSLDENVFSILDKMESLQNVRAQRWSNYMDSLGAERVNLAQLLMKTLDEIEQESGIFLIKPMYSLKGRDPISSVYSKYNRSSAAGRRRTTHSAKGLAPDNTPRPDPPIRSPRCGSKMGYSVAHTPAGGTDSRLLSHNPDLGQTSLTEKGSVWVAPLSEANRRRFDPSETASMINTPRILELDINRMLISQNAISARIPSSEDPLRIGDGTTLRSYVTINRPQATSLHNKERSASFAPTRTTLEKEISKSRDQTNTPTLPPIGGCT